MRLLLMILCIVFTSCIETENDNKTKVPVSSEFKPVVDKKNQGNEVRRVYVPIYSSIYNQYEENLLHLTAILSIRNTSMDSKIVIKKIDYYDTNGKLIKKYIDSPFELGKLASKDIVIAENDLEGGTGANFIVEWSALDNSIINPIIESVMIGNVGTKGFSFNSVGREIEE